MDQNLEEDALREQATVYKKETVRPLSRYQHKINEAAQEICIKSPSMLRNCSALLDAARVRVNESYNFKKGKSRSKRETPTEACLPKRPACSIGKNEGSGRRYKEQEGTHIVQREKATIASS